MIIDEISLLWPKDKKEYVKVTKRLSAETINDLSLDYICSQISNNECEIGWAKEVLTCITLSKEVVKYRQDIFEDIYKSEGFRKELLSLLEKLNYLYELSGRKNRYSEVSIWHLVSRLRELESYVECIVEMKECFEKYNVQSSGLKRLYKLVSSIISDPGFEALSKDIKGLTIEANSIKSLTFGMNLDSSLMPKEITLVSLNNTKFKESIFLKNLLKFSITMGIKDDNVNKDDFGASTKLKKLSSDKANPVIFHFTKDIEDMMKPTLKNLMQTLDKYVKVNISFLVMIIPELSFFLCGAELINKLAKAKMPVCKPKIVDSSERVMKITDVYNAKLAIHMQNEGVENINYEIITNTINFDGKGRIMILTGANRGGKTTYTQGIGLAQLFLQAGLYIPGREAELSLVDNIFTHFPADENQTVELGRLGEEAGRLSEIFKSGSSNSLVLLNESLSSTSHTEAIYIAKDVVKGLRLLGCKGIYNTHMHELGMMIDEINREVSGESKVVSYISATSNGNRSYKVLQGEPEGNSHASDIAIKHGISFEQIAENIFRTSNPQQVVQK